MNSCDQPDSTAGTPDATETQVGGFVDPSLPESLTSPLPLSFDLSFDAPLRVSLSGEPMEADWPAGNEITVEVVQRANPGFDAENDETRDEVAWAADTYDRSLVRIDTNYKSSRDGQYPVELTRTDTLALAAALLEAVEDTFHARRVGALRAPEALALLQALDEVEGALSNLRSHALADLANAHACGDLTHPPAQATTADPTTSDHADEPDPDEPGPDDIDETTGGAR